MLRIIGKLSDAISGKLLANLAADNIKPITTHYI